MNGGLIEMTAHMVTRPEAVVIMAGGTIVLTIYAGLAAYATLERKWRMLLALTVLAGIGAIMMIKGITTPRVREIKACASGAVSLEQIAVQYEIKGVDGKLLTLWER